MSSIEFQRRRFLLATAAGAALGFAGKLAADEKSDVTENGNKRMKMGMLVSYDDEVTVSQQEGQQLVDRMFGQLRDAGFDTVVWRSMRGGEPMFHSKEYKVSYPRNLATFDPMAVAKKKARELGLEFFVWHEVKGAEAHGWLLHSSFVKEHPELLSVNRMKMTSKSELSWAAPEVMRHRVNTFREVVAYEPDAIWIDHIKGGDVSVPCFDADGYYAMGYDQFMVEAFRIKTGRDAWQIPNNDPQWLAVRASFVTDYMRQIRKIQRESYPQIQLGSLGASIGYTHSCWYLPLKDENDSNMSKVARLASPLANLEDHDTWTREGLIDDLCAPFNTFSSADELKAITPDIKSHIHGSCRFAVSLGIPGGGLALPALMDYAQVAHEHGAEYLFVRESMDVFGLPAMWEGFKQVAQHYGSLS